MSQQFEEKHLFRPTNGPVPGVPKVAKVDAPASVSLVLKVNYAASGAELASITWTFGLVVFFFESQHGAGVFKVVLLFELAHK